MRKLLSTIESSSAKLIVFHKEVQIIMIHTHVLKRNKFNVRSPRDILYFQTYLRSNTGTRRHHKTLREKCSSKQNDI